MAHKFDDFLHLDAAGAPLAQGPVHPPGERMFRIWVWVTQEKTDAAARGSVDWGNGPVSPHWDCATTLWQDSPRFEKGAALGMAVAVVKHGNGTKLFGWWDDVEIV
jgi:hypothetical protein